jgi:hypothetical protein
MVSQLIAVYGYLTGNKSNKGMLVWLTTLSRVFFFIPELTRLMDEAAGELEPLDLGLIDDDDDSAFELDISF